jgi:hypothetical protein
MEAKIDQVLDGSFLDALGLSASTSNVPNQVVNSLAKQSQGNVLFTLTARYRRIDCVMAGASQTPKQAGPKENEPTPAPPPSAPTTVEKGRCCKLLVVPGPDAPWPVASPHLSPVQSFSFSASIDIPDIAKLSVSLTVSATPTLSRVSRDERCPNKCGDDTMDVGVEVNFEVTMSVSGKFHQVRSGGLLDPSSSALSGTMNFGPRIGGQKVSGGWFRDWGVDFTLGPIKFNKSYDYFIHCEEIDRVMDDGSVLVSTASGPETSASPPLPDTPSPNAAPPAALGTCPNPKPANEVQVDRVPPSRPHYPCPGDHWHCLEYHQVPYPDCRIFKKRTFGGCLAQGAAPPASC